MVRPRPRAVVDQVVVITGASSGIGRETALEFARHGSRVVLAARNREALDSLAAEVERLGGVPLVVPTDVGDYGQVTALADRAMQRFGRIDTWVNNAAVTVIGTVEQTDMAEIRRVIEVDLLGQIHGVKAALPHLRGPGGTIVNVSSFLGRRGFGLQAAYSAAKHGVLGFGEALRLELRHDNVPVDVVDVLPSSINTPLYEHARSKLGVLPRPIPIVYEPRVVAKVITAVAERPVRQVYVGGAGRLLDLAQRLNPALVDWYLHGIGRQVDNQLTGQPDDGVDNLYEPSRGPGRTTGEFGRCSLSVSPYTTLFGMNPVRGRAVAGIVLSGAAAALRWLGRRR